MEQHSTPPNTNEHVRTWSWSTLEQAPGCTDLQVLQKMTNLSLTGCVQPCQRRQLLTSECALAIWVHLTPTLVLLLCSNSDKPLSTLKEKVQGSAHEAHVFESQEHDVAFEGTPAIRPNFSQTSRDRRVASSLGAQSLLASTRSRARCANAHKRVSGFRDFRAELCCLE